MKMWPGVAAEGRAGALQRPLGLALGYDSLGGRGVGAHCATRLAALSLLGEKEGYCLRYISDGEALGGGDEMLMSGGGESGTLEGGDGSEATGGRGAGRAGGGEAAGLDIIAGGRRKGVGGDGVGGDGGLTDRAEGLKAR